LAGPGTLEQGFTHFGRIWDLTSDALDAQQQRSNPGDYPVGDAGAGEANYPSARHRPTDRGTGGEDALRAIDRTPIAAVEGFPVLVHGSHGESRANRGGHMQAVATIITRRCYDQDIPISAKLHRFPQVILG
jgi:hypothetical protein